MLRFEGRSSHGYFVLPPFSFFFFPLMHSPSKLLQGPLPAPCLWAGSFARDDAYLHCIHFKQEDTPSLFPRLWKPVDFPPSHSPPKNGILWLNFFFFRVFFAQIPFVPPFPPTAGVPSSIFHRNTCLQRQIFSPLTIPLSCCCFRVWGVERGREIKTIPIMKK